MAVFSRLNEECSGEVDMIWTDDGIMFRLPESDEPPDLSVFFPKGDEVEDQVIQQLGSSALFASKFQHLSLFATAVTNNRPVQQGRHSCV